MTGDPSGHREGDPRSQDQDPGRVMEILTFHLTNSPLCVVEWDHEFRVNFWSGRAEDVFGWTAEEVLGKHPSEWRFVHEADEEAVNEVMADLLAGQVPRNISANRNYTRDGTVVHCEWYNSVLTDDEGNLVSVLSLIHDVTARRDMEAQLFHLQKMESIGQLTGGVAHDFNNLLTVILGHADLLAESLEDRPELEELSLAVLQATKRGAGLTHQLLAFARQQPLEPRSVDVSELLEKLSGLLRRTLGEQSELRLFQPRELWPARVDPGQLESALLNLCLNARDAMGGGGRLSIECENVRLEEDGGAGADQLPAGDYVVLAISDTGSGIPGELQARVLEPFFTTKEVGRGSGLGLSMVYGFVKQSQGHLQLYSEEGKGTTVRMYLPRSDLAAGSDEPEAVQTAVPTGSETILLVEDDDLVRRYADLQLQSLGYTVIQSANGADALDHLERRGEVDLLFTDMVMPGQLDGIELAREALSRRPELRVLYTSGYTDKAFFDRSRLHPEVPFLAKPYQRSSLAQKVRDALDREPG